MLYHNTSEALHFDLNQALSPWSSFCNKEAVSDFEAAQLNLILKKFVKQLVSRSANSQKGEIEDFTFDKLLNVATNLTKTHASVMQKHARRLNQAPEAAMYAFYNNGSSVPLTDTSNSGIQYKPVDINFNFIRSLILDRVLENPVLHAAFLENKITNMGELEAFNKLSYSARFHEMLLKL